MNRYILFARRIVAAREFGLHFRGTSSMQVPTHARIAGADRPLSVPADASIAHDIINLWFDDEYGLRHVNHPVRTIVDIGANVGLFALLARHRFPDAAIHAYEPDPAVLAYTERNLCGMAVELYREGVAYEDGMGEVVSHGSTRLNQINLVAEGGVPLTRIETVVARAGDQIDVLKLDCEGFEWDLFKDADAFAKVRTLRMEYHLTGGRTLDDLFAVTQSLGFVRTHLHADDGFGIAWFDRAMA